MPLPQVMAAIKDLREARRELLRLVDSLSPEDWYRYVPYGEWTIKDVIAHLVGDMSPGGAGLILAGVLTPEFIMGTAEFVNRRAWNAKIVAERARLTPADLRQMLYHAHDRFIAAARRISRRHLEVLELPVPMGPGYTLKVEDWLWAGYHYRLHADDVRRALRESWAPEPLTFLPEVEALFPKLWRYRDGFLRAVYSVADDAWDEPCPSCPGWSYRDVVAHVASNETRAHLRLRFCLGEIGLQELAPLEDVDGWNQKQVEARRDREVCELVDELARGRYETLTLLSRLAKDHLEMEVPLPRGRTMPLLDYIGRLGPHEAEHAGHLVSASRARRLGRSK